MKELKVAAAGLAAGALSAAEAGGCVFPSSAGIIVGNYNNCFGESRTGSSYHGVVGGEL